MEELLPYIITGVPLIVVTLLYTVFSRRSVVLRRCWVNFHIYKARKVTFIGVWLMGDIQKALEKRGYKVEHNYLGHPTHVTYVIKEENNGSSR